MLYGNASVKRPAWLLLQHQPSSRGLIHAAGAARLSGSPHPPPARPSPPNPDPQYLVLAKSLPLPSATASLPRQGTVGWDSECLSSTLISPHGMLAQHRSARAGGRETCYQRPFPLSLPWHAAHRLTSKGRCLGDRTGDSPPLQATWLSPLGPCRQLLVFYRGSLGSAPAAI